MQRTRRAIALVSAAIILGLVAEAGAVDFSPTVQFALDDRAASSIPQLQVKVAQERGEEELSGVELRVPAGFTLANDLQLQNGENLGSGQIVIHAGPRCANAPEGSAPATVSVTITERDRTSTEAVSGVVAVYNVDIQGVTRFDLLVRGSTNAGYTLTGTIPGNAATCPPLNFDAQFRKFAGASGTPILINPRFGGNYRFAATFKGAQGATSTSEQIVAIDGPPQPGSAAAKKKCNKLKGKKKKKCKKRNRG